MTLIGACNPRPSAAKWAGLNASLMEFFCRRQIRLSPSICHERARKKKQMNPLVNKYLMCWGSRWFFRDGLWPSPSSPRSTFHPSDSLVYIFYPIKHEVKSLRLNRKRLGATFGNTFKIIYEIGVAALVFSLYCDYYCDVLNLFRKWWRGISEVVRIHRLGTMNV